MALFKSKTADASKDEKAIEIAQNRVREAMARLQTAAVAGNVPEADRCAKRALEALKNPKLPRDFMRDESARVKHLELTANMKSTDLALDRALAHALADRMQDRAKEIAGARGTMRKASSLGATREFVQISEKKIETIMLSGGVRREGPTVAKPLDTSPKPPNMAKSAPAEPDKTR